jgi:Domain of unknown function (DUF6458)
MGIGGGLFLVAAGAVLTFAVNVTTNGFNVNTIGIILMIVGALGVLVDLLVFAPRRRTTAVPVAPAGATRTVVEQRDAYL